MPTWLEPPIRDYSVSLLSRLEDPPTAVGATGGVTALWIISYGAYVFSTVGPKIGHDTEIYLHSGARTVNGAITYLHTFDVKPPGPHLIATAFHLVFDSRYLIYYLTVVLMGAVVIATTMLIALLVLELTGSSVAAIAAGLAPLAEETFATIFVQGLMGKPLIPALFFASLLLVVRGHRGWAVGLATLTPAFWQFAFPLPFLTMGVAIASAEKRWPRTLVRSVGIMMLVTTLVVLPYALAGALDQMLAQTVILPLVYASQDTYWVGMIDNWGLAMPILTLSLSGLIGLWWLDRNRSDDLGRAVVIGALWFTFVAGWMAQTGDLDMLVQAPLVAPGIGAVVAAAPRTVMADVQPAYPSISFRTALLGLVAIWILFAMNGWVRNGPVVPVTHITDGYYLAGETLEGCYPDENLIRDMFIDATNVDPLRTTCLGVRETLAALTSGK